MLNAKMYVARAKIAPLFYKGSKVVKIDQNWPAEFRHRHFYHYPYHHHHSIISIRLLEAPVRKIILRMHTPAGTRGLESANPAWTRIVHLDAPGQRHGQQPVSRTADP